jgi:hypothetical protein
MSNEIRIAFVDGHADVWRLFDDPAQLREIVEALVEHFRGDVTRPRPRNGARAGEVLALG